MKTARILLAGVMSAVLAGGTLAAPPAEPSVDYFALFLSGKKAGYGKEVRTEDKSVVTTSQTTFVTIRREGDVITEVTKEEVVETAEGKPLSFTVRRTSGSIVQLVSGKVAGDKMEITSRIGRVVSTRTIDWPAGTLMYEGLRLLRLKKGLKSGTTFSVKTFDPSTVKVVETDVVVGDKKKIDLPGRTLALTEVKAVVHWPGNAKIEHTLYLDDQARMRKEFLTSMGIPVLLVSCSEAIAREPAETMESLADAVVPCPAPLDGYRTARAITYHVVLKGSDSIEIPSGDSQKVAKGEGKEVVVTVRPAAAPKSVPFPYQGKDRDLLAATRPADYLQSDQKEIVALARRAVGSASDAATAARNIETFVRGYITKKDLTVGYASAAEVVQSRQGDCTEHAVLVAALLRAAGIPAKVVVGAVYSPRSAGKRDVMSPHAWARAYIGDTWLDLDAALEGFDAGHLAMGAFDGDPADAICASVLLGSLQITRVEIEQ